MLNSCKFKFFCGRGLYLSEALKRETGARIALDVKVGDKVIASKYAGTEVKLGSEEYIVVRADDILAIVE